MPTAAALAAFARLLHDSVPSSTGPTTGTHAHNEKKGRIMVSRVRILDLGGEVGSTHGNGTMFAVRYHCPRESHTFEK